MAAYILILCLVLAAATGLSSLTTGQAGTSHRSKRDVWPFSPVKDTATCRSTVQRVSRECHSEMQDKVAKIPKDSDHETERCCAFTDIRKCVRDRSLHDCGSGTTHAVDQVIEQLTKDWASGCIDYDYYSPTCLFFAWYTYVTLAAIAFLVLCCCCCVCCLRSMCCCC